MHLLLLGIEVLLFLWLAPRIGFIRKSGLSTPAIRGLICLKIAVCLTAGWMAMHIWSLTDSYEIFREVFPRYQALIHHPLAYIHHMPANYATDRHRLDIPFESDHSFWSYAGHQILRKIMMACDLLSDGGFFTDMALFGMVVFFGHIALYRFFRESLVIPVVFCLLAAFFVPSMLFWTSDIDKDAVLLVALGFFVFRFGASLRSGWSPGSWITLGVCSLVILLVRDYVLLLVLPALVAWALAKGHGTRKAVLIYLLVYAGSILIGLNLGRLYPGLDIQSKMAFRQQQFTHLRGFSLLDLPPLDSTTTGLIRLTPIALDHTLLRPYPWEIHNGFYFAACLETLGFLVFLVLSLILFRPPPGVMGTAAPACVAFGISLLLLVGWVVPYLGAINRYRSLALVFLVAGLSKCVNWGALRSRIIKAT